MSDLIEAFDAPVIYPISDTEKIKFPKFDLDELAELGASIKADRLKQTDELVKREELEGMESYRAKQEAAWSHVLDGDIFSYIETPKGTLEVLHKSLSMAGITDEAARKATLKKIPPVTKKHIALIVTGLAVPSRKKVLVSESGAGEPAFGDCAEKEVSPLAEGGLTRPST